MKSKLNVCGIMSGTSLDGVDFVLCRIDRTSKKMKLIDQRASKFPLSLRKSLLKAANHNMTVDELSELNYDLGRFYASALKKHKSSKKWKIDLVGLHGQTVYHRGRHATLQIGEPGFINQSLKLPVVSDFRANDLALRGEGAPMASLFHKEVLTKKWVSGTKPVAVQNIGGIGNVTYIAGNRVMSFDTGPGNMLMDELISKHTKGKSSFDKNGSLAAKGIPKIHLVKKWLTESYFRKPPPKSCGREEFGSEFLEQCLGDMKGLGIEDKMSTLCEFTALSIVKAYKKHLPKTPNNVVVAGGGAKNKHLLFRLRFHLPETEVVTSEDLGWPTDSVEGAAFALLAAYRVWEIPGNLPGTTGASRKAVLGKLTI